MMTFYQNALDLFDDTEPFFLQYSQQQLSQPFASFEFAQSGKPGQGHGSGVHLRVVSYPNSSYVTEVQDTEGSRYIPPSHPSAGIDWGYGAVYPNTSYQTKLEKGFIPNGYVQPKVHLTEESRSGSIQQVSLFDDEELFQSFSSVEPAAYQTKTENNTISSGFAQAQAEESYHSEPMRQASLFSVEEPFHSLLGGEPSIYQTKTENNTISSGFAQAQAEESYRSEPIRQVSLFSDEEPLQSLSGVEPVAGQAKVGNNANLNRHTRVRAVGNYRPRPIRQASSFTGTASFQSLPGSEFTSNSADGQGYTDPVLTVNPAVPVTPSSQPVSADAVQKDRVSSADRTESKQEAEFFKENRASSEKLSESVSKQQNHDFTVHVIKVFLGMVALLFILLFGGYFVKELQQNEFDGQLLNEEIQRSEQSAVNGFDVSMP